MYHRVLVGVFIRVGVANKVSVSSCIGGCIIVGVANEVGVSCIGGCVHKSGCG